MDEVNFENSHNKSKLSQLTKIENNAGAKIRPVPQKSIQNEIYYTSQAVIFTFLIFIMSYYGIRHGCMEYSLLDNGELVNRFIPPRKDVVTVNVGPSALCAIFYSLAVSMSLCSIISMSPHWCLPLIILLISDIVYNIGDAFVAFWLLFSRQSFSSAITYAAGAVFAIIGELWCWYGIVRLYELKLYESLT